jgi:hypothetical protein
MVSGLPKIDYGFVFPAGRQVAQDKSEQVDTQDVISASLRQRQFIAQEQSRVNTDIEQKYGQLYTLTNQEVDGAYADQFQKTFDTEFNSLAEMAKKNDPAFYAKRQEVAKSIVNFKNQIGQVKSYKDQIGTIIDSDPEFDHLNKNQLKEYIARSTFYNPDGTIKDPTSLGPIKAEDVKKWAADKVNYEATDMANPFINKDKVLSNMVGILPMPERKDKKEELISPTQMRVTSLDIKGPDFLQVTKLPAVLDKTGKVISPAKDDISIDKDKLKTWVDANKDQVKGLNAYLLSIGNDYSKMSKDILANPAFVKEIKVNPTSAIEVNRPNVTNVNTGNIADQTLYKNPDITIRDIMGTPGSYKNVAADPSKAILYDVTQRFGGFTVDVNDPANPFGAKKQPFKQVVYDPGNGSTIQPYFKFTMPDGSERAMQPDQASMYLNDISPSASYSKQQFPSGKGSTSTNNGPKKIP